jgi:methyltransferase (TIGR00027 family)
MDTRHELDLGDTARWVALYRALESERPDALFSDPFARTLAGERGRTLLDSLPGGRSAGWSIVVRTKVLDELILEQVAGGVDGVLNLAAGLDMRPYRLDLPPTLRWYEVDFPSMVAAKERLVDAASPRCLLERIGCDLADVKARRALFARVGAECRKVLVVTEGLLLYLKSTEVEYLARDLREVPVFRAWMFDHVSPEVAGVLERAWSRALGEARIRFAVRDLKAFFVPLGWRVGGYRPLLTEALRLRREPPFGLLLRVAARFALPWARETARRMAGVVLLLPA